MKPIALSALFTAAAAVAVPVEHESKPSQPSRPRIPTSYESAVMARRILALTPLGTLATIFPASNSSSIMTEEEKRNPKLQENRPAEVAGMPHGLMEYISDCEYATNDVGNPTLLAISIETSFKNIAAGSNVSLAVQWTPPPPPPPHRRWPPPPPPPHGPKEPPHGPPPHGPKEPPHGPPPHGPKEPPHGPPPHGPKEPPHHGDDDHDEDHDHKKLKDHKDLKDEKHHKDKKHKDHKKKRPHHPPPPPPPPRRRPFSPAALPRFSLLGYIEKIEGGDDRSQEGSIGAQLASCFTKVHPDAKWWLPGNRIHESHFVRLVVTHVYWIGGFGDRAYIGWIPVDEWKRVTKEEWEGIRLPGEWEGHHGGPHHPPPKHEKPEDGGDEGSGSDGEDEDEKQQQQQQQQQAEKEKGWVVVQDGKNEGYGVEDL